MLETLCLWMEVSDCILAIGAREITPWTKCLLHSSGRMNLDPKHPTHVKN